MISDTGILEEEVKTPTAVRGRKGSLKEGRTARRFNWRVEAGAKKNYARLGRRLARCGDLYRNGTAGAGLILVLPTGHTRTIARGSDLAPVVADRVRMAVTKDGKVVSELPKAEHLNAMLRSETFLRRFRPVEEVARHPFYRTDFTLARPGYHDRSLYVGPQPEVADGIDSVKAFLDVMEFESNADRTNAVAAALTVRLRHLWPGGKPLVLVTATKSHAGKGTVTEFVRGAVPKADLLYESVDWPMQSQFHRLLKTDPDTGVVVLDNVRLDSAGGHGRMIRSAFIESFVTNPEVTLASPSAGEPVRLTNRFVVVVNTNDGLLSTDLMNRALPIRLAPKGSVHDRRSPIGNPKLEFLPTHQARIDAELRGMVERWRRAGRPLDKDARHPMTPWAQAVGGILKHGGFTDFLANAGRQQTAHDPIRDALALLGAASPDRTLKPSEWAEVAVREGLDRTLFPVNERNTPKGRERAIGVLLKPRLGETFEVTTDRGTYRLRLEGGNRRWEPGKNANVRYVFWLEDHRPLPVDE